MTAPVRHLHSTVLRSTMDPADRRAILAYFKAMAWERSTGGVEARRIVHELQMGRGMDIPERYWTHVCCRCGEQGAVVPQNYTSTVLPIDWTCKGCGQFVCHNCTLTVPGSVPLRFREDTLCSEECWRKIGAPREEEEGGRGSGIGDRPESDPDPADPRPPTPDPPPSAESPRRS